MKTTNPLADLANKLGTVRVIWGIVGTLIASFGFNFGFINPEFFSLLSFDALVGGIVTISGAAFTYYQTFIRKLEETPGVKTQSFLENVKVSYLPFGNVKV